MNKFIVVEGLDGSGKSTQVHLLLHYFEQNKLPYHYIHFPRMDEPVVGDMIARFLRGEFGDVDKVDPYFIALLYAADRNNYKDHIKKMLDSGCYVLADRYVYSNIAFQCAKIANPSEKQTLRDWIIRLEYDYNALPKPDIALLVHMPFQFVQNNLRLERTGSDRDYLQNKADIHEKNMDLQKQVEAEYLSLTDYDSTFALINGLGKESQVLTPDEIHNKVLAVLQEKDILAGGSSHD